MEHTFNDFINTVDEEFKDIAKEIHQSFLNHGCICEVKEAKSGFVVSYTFTKTVLANIITRKSGMKLRIYPNHIQNYDSFLDTLPEKAKKEIKKASVCKRLINPDDCNPKCKMGYTFTMDGELYKKCRYMAFQFTLNKENNPYILQLINHEIESYESRRNL